MIDVKWVEYGGEWMLSLSSETVKDAVLMSTFDAIKLHCFLDNPCGCEVGHPKRLPKPGEVWP